MEALIAAALNALVDVVSSAIAAPAAERQAVIAAGLAKHADALSALQVFMSGSADVLAKSDARIKELEAAHAALQVKHDLLVSKIVDAAATA
jgi:hypothetical protein